MNHHLAFYPSGPPDVMSPRAVDENTKHPSLAIRPDEESSETATETRAGDTEFSESGRSRVSLTKPIDMRDPADQRPLKDTESSILSTRTRIAPVRLLGQGPYVIRTHARPDPLPIEKSVDYDEWRQAIMRRNVVDFSKYDSYARTTKQALPLPTAEPYDVSKFNRPRLTMLKSNNKLVTGYENNPMMRMLNKRAVQTNVLLYDSKDETRDSVRQPPVTFTHIASDAKTNQTLALPSIDPKHVKK